MGLLIIYTCEYIWMIWKHGRDTRKYLFISWPRDTNCRVPILQGILSSKGTMRIHNYNGTSITRINILQWILTKLGTYLDLKRIWNLIDFQGQRSPVTLTFDLWHWKSIEFQTLLRTTYVPSLVKIHWRMLILECSQGCHAVNIWPSDLENQ
jgi:hypothetical protein